MPVNDGGIRANIGEGKFVLFASTCPLVNFREASFNFAYFYFLSKKGQFLFPFIGPILGTCQNELLAIQGTCQNLRKGPRNPRNTQSEILYVPRTVLDKFCMFLGPSLKVHFFILLMTILESLDYLFMTSNQQSQINEALARDVGGRHGDGGSPREHSLRGRQSFLMGTLPLHRVRSTGLR